MQKEIKHTWFFNRTAEEVWEYLTKPELLEQWLMKSDFKPVLGHKFTFTCTKITYCEVLEITPCTKLVYSWKTESADSTKKVDSKVVWTLSPKGQGTELMLVHNGFTVLEDYTGHNNGWTTLVQRLSELLNTVRV